MGKVITVWGSPGSGKSMFCCILAKALTRDKRKAIIINADMNVPAGLAAGADHPDQYLYRPGFEQCGD